MRNRRPNWQNIIWREWRDAEDEKYAGRLFELVAGEPAGLGVLATMTVVGAFHGAVLALLAGLAAENWGSLGIAGQPGNALRVAHQFALAGGGAGGAIGLVAGIFFASRSWRSNSLSWLLPSGPSIEEHNRQVAHDWGKLGWLAFCFLGGWWLGTHWLSGLAWLVILGAGGMAGGLAKDGAASRLYTASLVVGGVVLGGLYAAGYWLQVLYEDPGAYVGL